MQTCRVEQELSGGVLKTHLISLSHVAVEDPSHALDGRMLQFMGASQVIIDASAQRDEQGEHTREGETLKEWIHEFINLT